MSINPAIKAKLQYTPPIQLTFVDPNTGKPADGKIKFFVNGTSTPKNAYQKANTPGAPFVAVQEIELNGAGSPNVGLYFFPFDENDKITEQLYQIEVTNAAGVPVITKVDFPPTSSGATPQSKQNVKNLLPSYGFDTLTSAPIYEIDNEYNNGLPNGDNDIGLGWVWERQGVDSKKAQVSVVSLNYSTITGNPKNKLSLEVKSATSDDTISRLYSRIGDYSSFQGIELIFSLNTNGIAGVPTNLNIKIFRTKLGVKQSEIVAGSITVNTDIKNSSTLTFTIPNLTGQSGFDNNDSLYWAIDLPKSDFKLELTASWLQESSGGLAISESSSAESSTSQLFAKQGELLGKDYVSNNVAQPVYGSAGGFHYNSIASEIALFAKDSNPGSYIKLTDNELFFNSLSNNTTEKNLISKLRAANIIQSRKTFVCTNVSTDEVDIKTGIGVKPLVAWSSSDPTKISVTKTSEQFTAGLFAENLGYTARVTFTDNFSPGKNPYSPAHQPTATKIFRVLPKQSPIVSWFGDSSNELSGTGRFFGQHFYPFIDIEGITPGSATTPAQVMIKFVDFFYSRHRYLYVDGSNTEPPTSVVYDFAVAADYPFPIWGYRPLFVLFGTKNSAPQSVSFNYFSYNSIINNPNEQPENPIRVIKFALNDENPTQTGAPINGSEHTLTVNLSRNMFAKDICKAFCDAINNTFVFRFKVLAKPVNGHHLRMNNGYTYYTVLFHDTAQALPAFPNPSDKTIIIKFTQSQTFEQIRDLIKPAIEGSQIGVPFPQDMGLDITNTEVEHYIHI